MTEAIEVPVLIVGGGPVGMTASILLSQQGIRNLVVERRSAPDDAPAAHVVNARTFEIFRAAGLDMSVIDAACKDPADGGMARWVSTLTGEELGALPFERQGEDTRALTPTPLRNLSQHRLEPILLEHLRKQPDAAVLLSHEWESAEETDAVVTSRVRNCESGNVCTVRSRYVLAADGAGSRVRKAAGIEMDGPARLRSFVMIHFEANLRSLVGHRPAVLFWTTAPGATGTFVAHDIDSTWVYMHGWDPDKESAEDYTEDVCTRIVQRAMGTHTAGFRIRNIRTWHMSVQIAARYRAGRTFLVGDAAHRFPPTGGLGLNTGVQDAHNLVWKLAAVENGWAPPSLLDSYERERRPIARMNADVSARNAFKLFEVYQALGAIGGDEPSTEQYAATLADPDARVRVRAAIENQAEHFDMLGLQLGYCYEAGALVPEADAPVASGNPVREYVPNARPGARLPHAWLSRSGALASTLDLVAGDRFTLISGRAGQAWIAAAAAGIPALRCLELGKDIPDGDGAWAAQLGIEPDGALLVRPDQHVAWRSARGVPDPRDALRAAYDTILGS